MVISRPGGVTQGLALPTSMPTAIKEETEVYQNESALNMGDLGSIPGLGRSPGEGKGYPLQCSGLENSMDREEWPAIVHGFTKS